MVKVVPKYEGIATLGVNLNRQKYGPLDVSSVLLTESDLIAYVAGDESSMSPGWTGGVPYPYPGQIIVTLDTNTVWQLYLDGEAVAYRKMFEMPDFYSKEEINETNSNNHPYVIAGIDILFCTGKGGCRESGEYKRPSLQNRCSYRCPPFCHQGSHPRALLPGICRQAQGSSKDLQ